MTRRLRDIARRLLKRGPKRSDSDWEQRTYPCDRWFCFRRSPAWRSFERGGKSWCDRHVGFGEEKTGVIVDD